MFEILQKENLCPSVMRMVVYAPLIAAKAQAGQFVILRVSEDGERIPLTVADYDRVSGTITIIFRPSAPPPWHSAVWRWGSACRIWWDLSVVQPKPKALKK